MPARANGYLRCNGMSGVRLALAPRDARGITSRSAENGDKLKFLARKRNHSDRSHALPSMILSDGTDRISASALGLVGKCCRREESRLATTWSDPGNHHALRDGKYFPKSPSERGVRNTMYKTKCPHCGFKLGNYVYADACPKCRHELEYNTRLLIPALRKDSPRIRAWPMRMFFGFIRLVES